MKKFAIVLLAIVLMATTAFANGKPALEKPLEMSITADLTEVEPNDTCADATANGNVIANGDSYTAGFAAAEDVDYFEVVVDADGAYTFQTHPGDSGDTKLYIFADDCSTQLAYNDDGGGQGYYSMLEIDLIAGTTYYAMVIPYNSSAVGSYLLTMDGTIVVPEPENNLCENALPLPLGTTFTATTCGASNDYNPGYGGCTGYSTNGLDIVYSVDLITNQELTITVATSYDNAIYLVTDCGDVAASCVIGADGTTNGVESFVFDASMAPGLYYLIIDGYSTACGDNEITVSGVVATEASSWDSVKSMYR